MEHFEWYIGQIEHRIQVLKNYVLSEGGDTVFDYSPESLREKELCNTQQQSEPEELPGRKGALREAKRDADIPYNQEPFDI